MTNTTHRQEGRDGLSSIDSNSVSRRNLSEVNSNTTISIYIESLINTLKHKHYCGKKVDEIDLKVKYENEPFANRFKITSSGDACNVDSINSYDLDIKSNTKKLVEEALKITKGHKSNAAKMLGIHPRTLNRMLRKQQNAD